MPSEQNTRYGTSRRYRTILVDPPWRLLRDDLRVLTAFPLRELADTDAYLWIWCTNRTLAAAYEALITWEFTPRPPLTWIKPCPGLDTQLRSSREHLVLGTRGDAEVNKHGGPAWMFTPVHDHEHRSDEEYAVIERVSAGPYLQLFANTPRSGWDTWRGRISSTDVRREDPLLMLSHIA